MNLSNYCLEENEFILEVSAGLVHNYAMTNLGRCIGWGYNSTGELGAENIVRSRGPHKQEYPGELFQKNYLQLKHSFFSKQRPLPDIEMTNNDDLNGSSP